MRDDLTPHQSHPQFPPRELDAVAVFAPWADGSERALRVRLYRSRDICGARAARTTGWANAIWKTAEDMAADTIWRRLSEGELRAIADAIGRMIQAASRLEDDGRDA